MKHFDDNYLWNEIQNGITNNVQNNSFWINIELEIMNRIASRKAMQSDKPEVGEPVKPVETNEKIRKFDKRQQNGKIIRA